MTPPLVIPPYPHQGLFPLLGSFLPNLGDSQPKDPFCFLQSTGSNPFFLSRAPGPPRVPPFFTCLPPVQATILFFHVSPGQALSRLASAEHTEPLPSFGLRARPNKVFIYALSRPPPNFPPRSFFVFPPWSDDPVPPPPIFHSTFRSRFFSPDVPCLDSRRHYPFFFFPFFFSSEDLRFLALYSFEHLESSGSPQGARFPAVFPLEIMTPKQILVTLFASSGRDRIVWFWPVESPPFSHPPSRISRGF